MGAADLDSELGPSRPAHSFKEKRTPRCSKLSHKCSAKRGEAELMPQSRPSAVISV